MTSSSKRWLLWFVGLLVVGALAAGVLRALNKREQAKNPAAAAAATAGPIELAQTDVFTLQPVPLLQGVPVSGTLKAVNTAQVKARVSGELRDLTVREGDFVQAGQVLARIDASDSMARARQSQEQAASSKTQVDVAQRQFDNNQALVRQGFISNTALDTSQANLQAAQANYRAALAATEVTNKQVSDAVLKAPISGQVAQRLVQNGERVGVDTRILDLVDLSRLELEAAFSAADSTQVRVGQQAELHIEGSTSTVMAQVARINPNAQAGSRSVLVYFSLKLPEGAQGALRQGLFAQGQLGTTQTALLAVPLSSVRIDQPTPYVQTIVNQQVVHQPVTLGQRGELSSAGGQTMVAVQGLAQGAVVLRAGAGLLPVGTAVRFTPTANDAPRTPASAPNPT